MNILRNTPCHFTEANIISNPTLKRLEGVLVTETLVLEAGFVDHPDVA